LGVQVVRRVVAQWNNFAASAEEASPGISLLATAICAVSPIPGIQCVVTASELGGIVLLLVAQKVDLALLAEVITGVKAFCCAALC